MNSLDTLKHQISVVVPSYNSHLTIKHTIEGVLAADEGYLKELIIVDSSDDELTRAIIDDYSDKVTKIYLDSKTIPATGRNIGAKHASGKLLAFIDSDAYPNPNWLSQIAKANAAGKQVGGGSYFVPPFQEKKNIAVAQLFLQFNEFLNTGSERVVDFVPSCNLFCERELFLEKEGFPDIRASEDTLFGIKVSKTHALWFLPEATVFHIFREEYAPFKRNQHLLGKYVFIYRAQNSTSFLYRGYTALVLLPLIVIAKVARMKLRILKSGTGNVALFLRSSALFSMGMLYWSAGFAEAVRGNNRDA